MSSLMSLKKALMASLVLAIAVSDDVLAQSDNEQMMNLVLQVQQLQDEIRSLRGQLEQQSFELEELGRKQRDQYLDLDRRLSVSGAQPASRNAAAAASVAVSSSPSSAEIPPSVASVPPSRSGAGSQGPALGGGSSSADTSVVTAGALERPEVSDAVNVQSSVSALSTPEVTSRAAQLTPESEQRAYDDAFQALKNLEYADAAQQFKDFLNQYPDSDLADNAQYWLGESYYVTRNYEIALGAFETLSERYPDSSKAGDGLLKIGFTHYELKQYDQARAALEQVQQAYPNSTLSRLAESRLRSMRLAGHF